MIEAKAIVFVRGKKPDNEIINTSKRMGIPLLVTKRYLFESCGILYQHGLRSF
ncbi:hypothetical protein [Desulfolucanica intricata]|uniref:hypothetical protein n=1 Tax=Desulfolucanica intricata TaxID=1285191 RepID=UPI000AFC80E6|nr:hypothetical protein [Desulfolucanica intricata]